VRLVQISARPEPLEIDLDQAAVLVVDMQNDFGSPGGMFDRAGIDIAPIRAIVPRLATLLADARAARLPIFYLKMQFAPDLADAGGSQAPNFLKHQHMQLGAVVPTPDGGSGRILVRDSWNTAIVPELAPAPEDTVVAKHRYSGFFETELDARLKAAGVTHLIVTGATTSVCVDSTVRDAMFRDYVCIVLSDCTAEPIAFHAPRSNHEASLLTFELLFGWVATSSDVRAALPVPAAIAG
jgi:ureidoacrylate peracid hydrolase